MSGVGPPGEPPSGITQVSVLRGWWLVDGHALAPGDPLFSHMAAEGLFP